MSAQPLEKVLIEMHHATASRSNSYSLLCVVAGQTADTFSANTNTAMRVGILLCLGIVERAGSSLIATMPGSSQRQRHWPARTLPRMEALRDISTAASDEVQRIVVSPSAKGSDSVETGGMSEKETPQFDWLSHWYPINVVETLDPSKPHAAQLLGKNLVIWNDGPTVEGVKQVGEWHVFEDACPHRLGPLSEGRVEADGTLLCSYHGWRFDGEGECADLPYSPEQVAERQRGSCRARCGGLPTKVADGFIWVFPRPGPDGYAASERVALP